MTTSVLSKTPNQGFVVSRKMDVATTPFGSLRVSEDSATPYTDATQVI